MSSDHDITRRDDVLDALPAQDAPFAPDPYPAPRSIARPFPMHPNFWWSLLWCVGMLLLTQVLGGVVAIVVLFVVAAVRPDLAPMDKLANAPEMMSLPAFQFAIGFGLWLAHALMIVLSLVVLRIVAGKSWAREVAVRRPALTHVLLVIVAVPTFSLLANGSYWLTEKVGIPGVSELTNTVAFLTAIVLALVVIGLGNLFLSVTVGFDWSDRVWAIRPAGPVAYSASLLLAFVALVAVMYNVLSAVLLQIFPPMPDATPSGMEEMMKVIAGWPLPLAVFLIAVMPGFSEELWCRAYLGRGLVGKHGYVWGVLTTSFLFGLIHIDPRQGAMAAVLGIALHYVYITTRSLWMPMLLHFLNNGLAVVLSRQVGRMGDLEKDATSLSIELFVAGGLLMAAVIWALWQTRARLVAPEGVTPWQPPHPGVACPPTESLTVVHSPHIWAVSALAVLVTLVAFVATLVMAVTRAGEN